VLLLLLILTISIKIIPKVEHEAFQEEIQMHRLDVWEFKPWQGL
jgi:hypothetical protein